MWTRWILSATLLGGCLWCVAQLRYEHQAQAMPPTAATTILSSPAADTPEQALARPAGPIGMTAAPSQYQ